MKIKVNLTTLAALGLMATAAALAQSTTLKGTVSDKLCGAEHMMSGSAAQCTRECVKKGSPYALVVGSKVYTLKGHSSDLYKYAGQNVVVKGTVSGTTVEVASVAPAK